jgi:hypothetical protein
MTEVLSNSVVAQINNTCLPDIEALPGGVRRLNA